MYPSLGILPIVVTTAVNLLVPAIESLFKSNVAAYSYPTTKATIDTWAGVVNLDPTFTTVGAQWAWANLRCAAGDPAAIPDIAAAAQLFPLQKIGPMSFRMTPDGPVPEGFVNPCTSIHPDAVAYATAAIRVLTTVIATKPPGDSLYGGTLPQPLPTITSQPNAGTPSATDITTLALVGVAAVAGIFLLGRR